MPANSPSRNRCSGRGSRARAISSGVSAIGASKGTPEFTKTIFGKVRTRSIAPISASAKLSSDAGSFVIHQVSHVGASHQGSAENHFEPDGKAVVAIGVELRGRYVGLHRQIAARWLQVLADGGDIHVGGAQIAEELLDFARFLAEARHQAALGQNHGLVTLAESKHVERLSIVGLRANTAIKPGDGFHVVVENVGR